MKPSDSCFIDLPLTRRRVSWVCPLFSDQRNTMPELASNGNEL